MPASRSAQGQFRRLGDVGDWSAYPSIADELVRCRERRNVPKAEVRPELQSVSSGGANSTRAALPESSKNHYRMP
jgi:hypothetical protein